MRSETRQKGSLPRFLRICAGPNLLSFFRGFCVPFGASVLILESREGPIQAGSRIFQNFPGFSRIFKSVTSRLFLPLRSACVASRARPVDCHTELASILATGKHPCKWQTESPAPGRGNETVKYCTLVWPATFPSPHTVRTFVQKCERSYRTYER